MIAQPLVSVLMTAYNRELFIAESIESVLASDFTDFELLIVDDGSTDDTVAIAEKFARGDNRIRLFVNEKNKGQFQNRNYAASMAKGKFLKYLDSDDIIFPHTLSLMVSMLNAYPSCGIAIEFRNCAPVPRSCFPFLLTSQESYLWHFQKGGLLFVSPSQVIFRRSHFEQVNGFDISWGSNADIDLILRVAANADVLVLPPNLVFWRRHENQVASQQERNAPVMLMERFKMHKARVLDQHCPLLSKQRKSVLFSMEVMYIRSAVTRHLLQQGFRVFRGLFTADTVPFYKLPVFFFPLRLVRLI